VLQTIKKG